MSLDELARVCEQSPQMSMILLGLEMKQIVISLPGSIVELVDEGAAGKQRRS